MKQAWGSAYPIKVMHGMRVWAAGVCLSAPLWGDAAGIYTCHAERPTTDQQAGDLLKARDEMLCCVSDELIAVFDGSKGGTSHTVRKWDGFGGRGRLHRIDPREIR